MDLIPIEFQQHYKQILDYINAYKNGVTSDTMQSYGIHYEKNFGVSIIDLKRISERFRNSHDLANLLWEKGWRETYILSTLIDEAQTYSVDLLAHRVSGAPTFEILEQFAYNVAWQVDCLDAYFDQVEDRESKEMLYFLIKSTTYQLMKKKITAKAALERISKFTFSDEPTILNVLQNLLLRICADDNSLHKATVELCESYTGESWKMLSEIIREYGIS